MSKVLIVDDSDPAIAYTGSWTSGPSIGTNTNEYDSTVHQSGAPGDQLSYTFYGTGVSLYGTLDSPATYGNPNVSFSIDNSTPTAFNASRKVFVEVPAIVTSHVHMYQSPTLEKGFHTLTIKTGTTANPAARLYVDFLTVSAGSDTASGNIIVDDRDPSIVYSGSWSSAGSVVEYEGTTSRAGSNGSAMFRFNGSSITIYGTTSESTGSSTKPSVGFSLDGAPNATYIGPQVAPVTRHKALFHAGSLSSEEHTVVMGSILPMPWFLDFIVYATQDSTGGTGGDSPSKTGVIAGGVVGGVVGLLALLALIIVLLKRQVKGEEDKEKVMSPGAPIEYISSPDTPAAGPRKYDRLSSHIGAVPMEGGVVPSPANPEPPSSLLGDAPEEYSDHAAWSHNAAGSHAGQQEGYMQTIAAPPTIRTQSPEYSTRLQNDALYPQLAAGARESTDLSSTSYSPSATGSPNDRATMHSSGEKSQFTHVRSSSSATQGAISTPAPVTIYPTIEEDSGIRIPRTSPPLYTAD